MICRSFSFLFYLLLTVSFLFISSCEKSSAIEESLTSLPESESDSPSKNVSEEILVLSDTGTYIQIGDQQITPSPNHYGLGHIDDNQNFFFENILIPREKFRAELDFPKNDRLSTNVFKYNCDYISRNFADGSFFIAQTKPGGKNSIPNLQYIKAEEVYLPSREKGEIIIDEYNSEFCDNRKTKKLQEETYMFLGGVAGVGNQTVDAGFHWNCGTDSWDLFLSDGVPATTGNYRIKGGTTAEVEFFITSSGTLQVRATGDWHEKRTKYDSVNDVNTIITIDRGTSTRRVDCTTTKCSTGWNYSGYNNSLRMEINIAQVIDGQKDYFYYTGAKVSNFKVKDLWVGHHNSSDNQWYVSDSPRSNLTWEQCIIPDITPGNPQVYDIKGNTNSGMEVDIEFPTANVCLTDIVTSTGQCLDPPPEPYFLEPGGRSSPEVLYEQPTLKWVGASTADKYEVTVFREDSSNSSVRIYTRETTDRELKPNISYEVDKVYSWQVVAINDAGWSLPSDKLYFKKEPRDRTLTIQGSWISSGGSNFTNHTDNHVYKFENTRDNRQVTIDLKSTTVDTYLYLFDTSGGILAKDDDSGTGLNSQITKALPSGVYYLLAATYAKQQSGNYDFVIKGVVKNLKLSSSPLIYGSTEYGCWDSSKGSQVPLFDYTTNYFYPKPNQNPLHYINIVSWDKPSWMHIDLSSTVDKYLKVIKIIHTGGNLTTEVVASDDDSGFYHDSRISVLLPSAHRIHEEYYAIVAGTYRSGETGSFSLSTLSNGAYSYGVTSTSCTPVLNSLGNFSLKGLGINVPDGKELTLKELKMFKEN